MPRAWSKLALNFVENKKPDVTKFALVCFRRIDSCVKLAIVVKIVN